MKNNVLIYGASGYVGKLLAQRLVKRGISPVLAGRSNSIEPIARELKCEFRVFPANDAGNNLDDVDVLINLAGPFALTQTDLIKACIASRTSYLDIAGEVPEVENSFKFHEEAKEAGITIMSGAGFSIIPMDIAGKIVHEMMPDAEKIMISYAVKGWVSRGTLKTMLKDINKPGIIVENGDNKPAQPAMKELKFSMFGKSFKAVYNPWRADLFTLKKNTGIPNIEAYTAFPGFVVSMMKGKNLWLRNLILNKFINWLPEGPSERQLKGGKTYIKATAVSQGKEASVEILGPEGYIFTVEGLIRIMNEIKNSPANGTVTPSFFGKKLIEGIEGLKINIISSSA